tara:strand:+ start:2448 stop:2858 length:411 start_codon:yes stop_codon:yes gene_type:complete
MKNLITLLFIIPIFSFAQECKIPKYKVYPTENKEVSLKLDSATGEVWQVEIGVETGEEIASKIDFISNKTDSTFEKVTDFSDVMKNFRVAQNGRFELFPTNNIYEFLMVDTILGTTYQVQWHNQQEKRLISAITDY